MLTYKTYYIGENNNIEIILLKKPDKEGMLGMVNSKLFVKNRIGLHLLNNNDSDYLILGSFYISSHENQPMIGISQEIFNSCDGLSSLLSTVIFHELGHYYYGHYDNASKMNEEKRVKLIEIGKVHNEELEADNFAVKHLGKEIVIEGLQKLKDIALNTDADNESLEIATLEIELRIKHLQTL